MPLADSLSLDLAMARVGFGRYAAYPIASAAGIFTNVVFGLMRGSILLALFRYDEGTILNPKSLPQRCWNDDCPPFTYATGLNPQSGRVRSGTAPTRLAGLEDRSQ